jgi:hypothetical protein
MTAAGRTATARMLTGSLLLVCFCLLSGLARAEADISVIAEPGFPLKGGAWMIPVGLVDGQGNPLDVPADDLVVSVDGQPVSGYRLGEFGSGQGGYPSSVGVLTDGGYPLTGIENLAAFLGRVDRNSRKALFLSGPEVRTLQAFGVPALTLDRCEQLMGQDEPGRLWDSILEALALLEKEGSARKVLLVVSAGGEDLLSEHPLATCVDGALRARVAVHYLELPGYPAGASRLRELARKSGGWTTSFEGLASLQGALAVVENVRPLLVTQPGPALPAEVAVGFGFSDQVKGTATVAEPKPLTGTSTWVLAALVLGVLAVCVVGYLLYRSVTRKSGLLVVKLQAGNREVPIPRSGVTIGSDQDNVLVLADPRISRHHAVVRERSGQVIITDLRSTHGTTVNGQVIRNASLRDGDRVVLGKAVELTLRNSGSAKR